MNPVKMTLIISVTLTLCDYLLGACIYVSISIYSLSYYRVFFFYYFLCLFARDSEGAQAVGAAGGAGSLYPEEEHAIVSIPMLRMRK